MNFKNSELIEVQEINLVSPSSTLLIAHQQRPAATVHPIARQTQKLSNGSESNSVLGITSVISLSHSDSNSNDQLNANIVEGKKVQSVTDNILSLSESVDLSNTTNTSKVFFDLFNNLVSFNF